MNYTIHAALFLNGQEKIEEEIETVEVLAGTVEGVSGSGDGWAGI